MKSFRARHLALASALLAACGTGGLGGNSPPQYASSSEALTAITPVSCLPTTSPYFGACWNNTGMATAPVYPSIFQIIGPNPNLAAGLQQGNELAWTFGALPQSGLPGTVSLILVRTSTSTNMNPLAPYGASNYVPGQDDMVIDIVPTNPSPVNASMQVPQLPPTLSGIDMTTGLPQCGPGPYTYIARARYDTNQLVFNAATLVPTYATINFVADQTTAVLGTGPVYAFYTHMESPAIDHVGVAGTEVTTYQGYSPFERQLRVTSGTCLSNPAWVPIAQRSVNFFFSIGNGCTTNLQGGSEVGPSTTCGKGVCSRTVSQCDQYGNYQTCAPASCDPNQNSVVMAPLVPPTDVACATDGGPACSVGYTCVAGVCLEQCVSGSDGGCPSGQECANSYCLSSPTCPVTASVTTSGGSCSSTSPCCDITATGNVSTPPDAGTPTHLADGGNSCPSGFVLDPSSTKCVYCAPTSEGVTVVTSNDECVTCPSGSPTKVDTNGTCHYTLPYGTYSQCPPPSAKLTNGSCAVDTANTACTQNINITDPSIISFLSGTPSAPNPDGGMANPPGYGSYQNFLNSWTCNPTLHTFNALGSFTPNTGITNGVITFTNPTDATKFQIGMTLQSYVNSQPLSTVGYVVATNYPAGQITVSPMQGGVAGTPAGWNTGSTTASLALQGAVGSLSVCDQGPYGSAFPHPAVCDGLDNLCDGAIDDGIPLSAYCGCSPSVPASACPCGRQVYPCDSNAHFVACTQDTTKSSTEKCDGVDNDCDGLIDDYLPYVENGHGLCENWGYSCQYNGTIGSTSDATFTPAPISGDATSETCNGIDDDCDGLVDNVHQTCTQNSDCAPSCPAGSTCTCQAGLCTTPLHYNYYTYTSGPVYGPIYAAGGSKPGVGQCTYGVQTCVASKSADPFPYPPNNGTGSWQPQTTGLLTITTVEHGPSAEACNGLDDDCDGYTDNQTTGSSPLMWGSYYDMQNYNGLKGLPATGQCKAGIQTCDSGKLPAPNNGVAPAPGTAGSGASVPAGYPGEWGITTYEVGPSAEVCNGLDDDCNGQTDDGLGNTACGTGVCFTSIQKCVGGSTQTCVPLPKQTEVCDNRDNDCDGLTDNIPMTSNPLTLVCEALVNSWNAGSNPTHASLVSVGATSTTEGQAYTDTGQCTHGLETCSAGNWSSCPTAPSTNGEVGPSDEICNGLDDDCDGQTDNRNPGTICPMPTGCTTAPNCHIANPACNGATFTGTSVAGIAYSNSNGCMVAKPGQNGTSTTWGGCTAGYYDLNGQFSDGCETSDDSYGIAATPNTGIAGIFSGTGSTSYGLPLPFTPPPSATYQPTQQATQCMAGASLGTISAVGQSLTANGWIPIVSFADFYQVGVTATPVDTGGYEAGNLQVSIASPHNDYLFYVWSSDTGGTCSGEFGGANAQTWNCHSSGPLSSFTFVDNNTVNTSTSGCVPNTANAAPGCIDGPNGTHWTRTQGYPYPSSVYIQVIRTVSQTQANTNGNGASNEYTLTVSR